MDLAEGGHGIGISTRDEQVFGEDVKCFLRVLKASSPGATAYH